MLIVVVWFLNFDELWEVMSVIFGEIELIVGYVINDVCFVLFSCGSLVMIDEE